MPARPALLTQIHFNGSLFLLVLHNQLSYSFSGSNFNINKTHLKIMPITSSTSPLHNTVGSGPGMRNQASPWGLQIRWVTSFFPHHASQHADFSSLRDPRHMPSPLAWQHFYGWHNLSVTDKCLSHRSLNPLPDVTVKHQGKASSTHCASPLTGITSGRVRAGKTPSCISEPCMSWWHKGTWETPAAPCTNRSALSIVAPFCIP